MNSNDQFMETKQPSHSPQGCISNKDVLTASGEQRPIKILWMYPSTLSLHGGRGDLMALLRFATLAKRPVDIRRVENLNDPVPLQDADLLYFCAGDLACVPDVIRALTPKLPQLQAFAHQGKVIVANGSTGAILAKDITLTDGTVIPGLGLLGMHWVQRNNVHGDDLWLKTQWGEIIGDEITRSDITLDPDQPPLGQVIYGRGNRGDGFEGAIQNNVIYTSCLGPVLVRNPTFAMELLRRASIAAGIPAQDQDFCLSPQDIPHELSGLEEAKIFIQKKMKS